MLNKVFLLSNKDNFSTHINSCLKEDSIETEVGSVLPKYDYDVIIINLILLDEKIEAQIDDVLKSKVKKIILVESALDLYLNSKNLLPFSVYSEIIPKNEICKRRLFIENKIVESKKKYVIFRVSEVYGISMPNSLVDGLLFDDETKEFENSERDFVYDGDVISAIEIALRKDVTGIFDIASGESIELKKLVELIKKIRKVDRNNISWRRKKLKISINCDNFKYYKWEPLVSLEIGLKTLLSFRRNNVKLSSTRNSFRKSY